ncbi:MAG: hypothetical protein ACLR2E_00005 [Lachnospiraceae bacterium]
MTFPETVKTTLWDIIDEMSLSILFFLQNNPDKDFLRRRKLDFKKMMRLIISMEILVYTNFKVDESLS